jgi:predicted PurR-regulated permease PerM
MNGSAQASKTIMVLLAVVVVVAAMRAAEEVLMPLAVALLMTFLLVPLVDRLQRWGANRVVAVFITVVFAFTVVSGLVYVVFHQVVDLVQALPQYQRQLRANLADLSGALRGGVGETTAAVEQLTEVLKKAAPAPPDSPGVRKVQVVDPPRSPMEALSTLVSPFLKPVGTAALVIVFMIFMLLRYADLRDRFIRLLGSRNLRATTEALDDAARRVSRFLIMQTLINGWQGLLVTIGLSLIGLPNAALWGALTVVLRFIPYAGPWMAAAMPVALAFAVFDNWTDPLLTVGLFVVLELISNMVLEPWLYGSRTGVSPVALLVAAAFWTWLWGLMGLFLAIPLTVCLVVMGKYIPQLEFLHVMLGDQPVLEPHEQLYQRLLASNREEADDLLNGALRTQSLLEVCDTVVVRAMQLAEQDFERGTLREAKRQAVLDHLDRWADELLDSTDPARRREQADLQSGSPLTVLCVPAADRADEVCAKLLAVVLRDQGVIGRALTRAEARAIGNDEPPNAIVISALPPDAVVHARHACKRIRGQFAEVPLLVGLWQAQGDLQKSSQRLEPVGCTRLVTSFSACLSQLQVLMSAGRGGAVHWPAKTVAAPRVHA